MDELGDRDELAKRPRSHPRLMNRLGIPGLNTGQCAPERDQSLFKKHSHLESVNKASRLSKSSDFWMERHLRKAVHP
jgi:hypothetical protein